jgi:hypothetical protein
MNEFLRILIAALVVCDVSVSAEQTSFGDLAREAEKRKETAERPSKTYTNDDLRPVERSPSAGRSSAGCQSEHKYDPTSGDTYLIARCSDGTTRVQGSNTRTGAEWSQTIHADRSQSGTDKCGYRWTYDAQTKSYKNENGETRQGEVAFRERLESPMPCAAKSAPERPAGANSNQPFCVETSRTDTSGNRYLMQRCLDGRVRESGTDSRNGTTRQWHTTIHPDGSQSGENGCGVSWNYDAKTDRYETSLGEQGMGRNVFLGNLERLKRCDVYPRP